MPSNVCQIIITFLVASDLLCFYCILFLFCVFFFLYFVFNFLHCSTGQKLMLLGRCIVSILLFPFIFIVYLVYDFTINKRYFQQSLYRPGMSSNDITHNGMNIFNHFNIDCPAACMEPAVHTAA